MPRNTVLEQAGKASSKREFFIKKTGRNQPYKDLTAFQICRGESQCKVPKSEVYVRCPEAAAGKNKMVL